MPTTIDSLNLKFTADTSSAAANIDKLADSLSNLGKKLGPNTMKNLGNLASALSSVDAATSKSTISSIGQISGAFRQLTGASTIINHFVEALGSLNASLANFKTGSKYLENVKELASAFGSLSEKINSINSGRIKELSSSIRSFAGSTSKINDILSGISFTDAGLQAKVFAKTTVEGAKQIIEQYGIVGDDIQQEVITAVTQLAEAARNSNSYTVDSTIEVADAYTKLASILFENARMADDSKKIYMDLLEWVARTNAAGTKVLLPFNGQAEFRDAYSSMRSTLGKAFTSNVEAATNERGETRDIADYVAEMNDAIGTSIDVSGNAATTFQQLYEALKYARQETQTLADAQKQGKDVLGELNYNLNSFLQSLQNSTANTGSTENVFKALAEGLQSLGDLNIPDSDKLVELVSAISKFGLKSASAAPGNISALSESLSKLINMLANAPAIDTGVISMIQSVGNMVANLRALASTATAAASGMNSFKGSMSGLSGRTAASIQNIGKSMQMLSNGSGRTPGIMRRIADAIKGLKIADAVSRGIKNLGQGLSSLASKTASKAASAIHKVADKLNIFSKSADNASRHGKGLASIVGSLYAKFWMLGRAFNWAKDAVTAASDLVEVQNVVNKTFGESVGKVEEFAKSSIETYGMSELSAKQFASRFQAMGTALGYSQRQMSDYSIQLTKLAADMGSFYNRDYADTAKALESIFTGQSKPLRQYGIDITEATLQEWAMKRGMDANIESMTQAEKVMLRYEYVLERLKPVQGDFVDTIDRLRVA